MEIAVVILAAGKGTRMKSPVPKVLHKVAGKSLIAYIVELASSLKPERIITVISPDLAEVADEVKRINDKSIFVIQKKQLGTGDALKSSLLELKDFNGVVLVLYGDTAFLSLQTLQKILKKLETSKAAISLLAFTPNDPGKYGRLVLNELGELESIVEYADASKKEHRIKLCNSGVMAIDGRILPELLADINDNNAKGEYYLTDIISAAKKKRLGCCFVECNENEVMGVNSQMERAKAEEVMQDKLRSKAMENGVNLIAPETVFFSHDTEIESGVIIHPYVVFGSKVKICQGAEIKSFSHIEGAEIKKNAVIGPFARIRPDSIIEEDAKIGNFVEIKKSKIGKGAKINHLSYIGDTLVGNKSNIGAGTITCNYDGFNKHQTRIGENSFIGSNTTIISPIKIGKNVIVGAGTIITEDIEDDSLALGERSQKNISKGAEKFRNKRK